MVEIPDADARTAARILRQAATSYPLQAREGDRIAELLDPKPRTLRDEARAVVPEQWQADAVLAAVKARLDALPRSSWEGFPTYIHVNDIDALFRGTS